MSNTHDRMLSWVTPVAVALLTFAALVLPILLPLAVYFAVSADARKGTWAHTAAMGAVALLGGLWIWGYAGLGWLFVCVAPAVTALICYQKKLLFSDGLLYSLVAGLLSLIVLLAIVTMQHGQNPILLTTGLLERQIRLGGEDGPLFNLLGSQQAMLEWSASSGSGDFSSLYGLMYEITHLSMDDFISRVLPTYERMLRLYAPTVILAATLTLSVVAWVLPGFTVKRCLRQGRSVCDKVSKRSLPRAFIRWSLPTPVWIGCMIVMVIAFFTQTTTSAVVASGVAAAEWIARTLLIVQGVALSAFWMKEKRVPYGVRIILLVVGAMLFGTLFMLLGFAEGSFHLRKAMILRKNAVYVQTLITRYKDDPEEMNERLQALYNKLEAQEEAMEFTKAPKPTDEENHQKSSSDDHKEDL